MVASYLKIEMAVKGNHILPEVTCQSSRRLRIMKTDFQSKRLILQDIIESQESSTLLNSNCQLQPGPTCHQYIVPQ